MADNKAVLDPAKGPKLAKADAWDAYQGATTLEDLQARLDKLPLEKSVKAELWDAKAAELSQSKPTSWSQKLGLTDPRAKWPVDLAEGAVAGLASTVYQGGDLIRRAVGSERIINKPEVQQATRA